MSLKKIPGATLLVVLLCAGLTMTLLRRRSANIASGPEKPPTGEEVIPRESQNIATWKAGPGSESAAGDLRECKAGPVTLRFSAQDYTGCKSYSHEKALLDPTDGAIGGYDSPGGAEFELTGVAETEEQKKSGTSWNSIQVFPLTDPTVSDYGKAYPYISGIRDRLKELFRTRPKTLVEPGFDFPDLATADGGHDFYGKVTFVELPTIEGVSFLTRISQEAESALLDNEDLIFDFQGLTRDGRYYVCAHLSIGHPSLPKNYEEAKKTATPSWAYARRAHRQLDALEDSSYQPSLPRLWRLMDSLSMQ